MILSRTPIVTPDVPEFESAFYNYQEELERRLMWTFPKWYYFKKGTVAEREFTEAQKYPVPFHRGVWFPKGSPDLKHGRDRRFKQDVVLPKKHFETEENKQVAAEQDETIDDFDDIGRPIKPHSRITAADEQNDQSSLERKLPRTLYLVVRDSKSNAWRFPSFDAQPTEGKGLHQIAEDGLRTLGGDKINTWSVSNSPAAVVKYASNGVVSNDSDPQLTREFFMKSHIIAGKFDLQKACNDINDYKWLVKEEIEQLVDAAYFNKISSLLSDI